MSTLTVEQFGKLWQASLRRGVETFFRIKYHWTAEESADGASEVAQRILNQILNGRGIQEEQLANYALRVACNYAIDYYRKNTYRGHIKVVPLSSAVELADHRNCDDGYGLLVWQALAILPQPWSVAMALKLSGLPDREAAKRLGIGTNAYKSRLHRSRLLLAKSSFFGSLDP